MPARRAEMLALGRAALVDARLSPVRAQLRFAAVDGVPARVGALAAAEAECCPFLTLRVTGEPGVVLLTVDAPEEAGGVLAELVESFRGRAT
jgi:hypothetical protein